MALEFNPASLGLNVVRATTVGLVAYFAFSFLAPIFSHAETAFILPPPTQLEQVDPNTKLETAVIAGGCFWGVQGVFQHLNGVKSAVSGYAGGKADTANYETVSDGASGHAESVMITFDPNLVNYATILQVYFSVVHNPTELNHQGPDTGTQYRSAIFAQTDMQKQVAEAYIAQLGESAVFKAPIVTKIEMAKTFYPAEAYHQDYATLHPGQGYIAMYDLPKIENLKALFPKLYVEKPKLVGSAS